MIAAASDHDMFARVRPLLLGFRLLEAAGVCEFIAGELRRRGLQSFGWWSALAATARTYRVALFDTEQAGHVPIESWTDSNHVVANTTYFNDEKGRLSLEHEYWLDVIPGGAAYVAWLTGYIAAAELDGRRACDALRRCVAIGSQFVDTSDLARAPSGYEQLQLAADLLPRFLPLPQHALRDMRRFALEPQSLPS